MKDTDDSNVTKESIDKIFRILDKAINLEKEVEYELTYTRSVPIDNFLNRCVKYLEQIDAIAIPVGYDAVEKGKVRQAVENIYTNLQKYKGLERQDYEQNRTIYLDDLTKEDMDRVVESATAYSGSGQGFAHVNWNAHLLMGTHGKEDKPYDHYWKPTGTKPVRDIDESNYESLMAEHESNRSQTHEEWVKDMEVQKKEVLAKRKLDVQMQRV